MVVVERIWRIIIARKAHWIRVTEKFCIFSVTNGMKNAQIWGCKFDFFAERDGLNGYLWIHVNKVEVPTNRLQMYCDEITSFQQPVHGSKFPGLTLVPIRGEQNKKLQIYSQWVQTIYLKDRFTWNKVTQFGRKSWIPNLALPTGGPKNNWNIKENKVNVRY